MEEETAMTDRSDLGSPNPHRLYRNPDRGVLAGVCAGIADYLGVRTWQVRLAAVILLFIFSFWTVVLYILAAIFLKRRPAEVFRNPEEERFWRSVSGRPLDTFSGLRHKFRELDARLAGLERHVTSDEFTLDREIRKL
jgi:phage shock protein C